MLSVIIAHTVLGPIGWKIGTFISDIVYAGISGSFRVVFGAIFGFVYAPLVITGLHHMSNAIDMQLIADFGGTMLWPMIALSNIAQGSAVLGMIYLQRKNAAAQEVNVPSCISCYLGVTEPAMFGVNLKFHFPFICGMDLPSQRSSVWQLPPRPTPSVSAASLVFCRSSPPICSALRCAWSLPSSSPLC